MSAQNLRRWLESGPQGRFWEEGVAKHYACIGGVYMAKQVRQWPGVERTPDYLELFGSATHGVLTPGAGTNKNR